MKIVRDMFIGLLVCLVVVIPIRVINVMPETLMFNIGFVTLLICLIGLCLITGASTANRYKK